MGNLKRPDNENLIAGDEMRGRFSRKEFNQMKSEENPSRILKDHSVGRL